MVRIQPSWRESWLSGLSPATATEPAGTVRSGPGIQSGAGSPAVAHTRLIRHAGPPPPPGASAGTANTITSPTAYRRRCKAHTRCPSAKVGAMLDPTTRARTGRLTD